jgi:ubiquitin-like domain-containing CTD phosphatase 1
MNPPREGKHLLVLDLDYTVLDTKPLTAQSLPPKDCARPHLHEFLSKVYPFYDICIWSQTSWIWLETKLVELGIVSLTRDYKVSKVGPLQSAQTRLDCIRYCHTNLKLRSLNGDIVLDKTAMFSVFSTRNGRDYRHSVKPLRVIWNHFQQ